MCAIQGGDGGWEEGAKPAPTVPAVASGASAADGAVATAVNELRCKAAGDFFAKTLDDEELTVEQYFSAAHWQRKGKGKGDDDGEARSDLDELVVRLGVARADRIAELG